MIRTVAVLVLLAAGCPKRGDNKRTEPTPKRDASLQAWLDGGAPALPPAPPLPVVPAGLPPVAALANVTPEAVALGELLFHDTRLSSTGTLACASCHVPAQGYAGGPRQATAAGKPNLRRAPTLVNLAWANELGWDGRYRAMAEHLPPHVRGQLGDELATSLPRILELPLYRAHFARVGGAPTDAALAALAAFALTRYEGDAPWDRLERDPAAPAPLKAGYQLFTGKAACSQCHLPPLYTDHAYHRLGLIGVPDEGRGRIDKSRAGAFRTPTLRGATRRTGFFHDGSAATLDAAIDWHLVGGLGQGADRSIVDVHPVTLTRDERDALAAFVEALTGARPAPAAPTLP